MRPSRTRCRWTFNVLWDVQFDVSGQGEEHRAGGRAVMGDYFEALGFG